MHKNASDIFCLQDVDSSKDTSKRIYSVGGSPSVRLTRRREEVSSVYPYNQQEETECGEGSKEIEEPIDVPDLTIHPDGDSAPVMLSPKEEASAEDDLTSIPVSSHNTNMKRNPLTGEGIETVAPRSGRRRVRGRKSIWTW